MTTTNAWVDASHAAAIGISVSVSAIMRRGVSAMARAMLATKGDATTTRTIGTSVAREAKAAVAKGKGGKAGKGNE